MAEKKVTRIAQDSEKKRETGTICGSFIAKKGLSRYPYSKFDPKIMKPNIGERAEPAERRTRAKTQVFSSPNHPEKKHLRKSEADIA